MEKILVGNEGDKLLFKVKYDFVLLFIPVILDVKPLFVLFCEQENHGFQPREDVVIMLFHSLEHQPIPAQAVFQPLGRARNRRS